MLHWSKAISYVSYYSDCAYLSRIRHALTLEAVSLAHASLFPPHSEWFYSSTCLISVSLKIQNCLFLYDQFVSSFVCSHTSVSSLELTDGFYLIHYYLSSLPPVAAPGKYTAGPVPNHFKEGPVSDLAKLSNSAAQWRHQLSAMLQLAAVIYEYII